MASTKTNSKLLKTIVDELKEFKQVDLKEVLDYIYYTKAKESIDPSQIYFWTKKWQQWEMEAEKDKKAGKIIGNGTIKDLVSKLRE